MCVLVMAHRTSPIFVAKDHKPHFCVLYLVLKVSFCLILYNFWDEWIIDLQQRFVLG